MNWIDKLRRRVVVACIAGACLVAGSVQGAELPTPRLESEVPQPGNPSLVLLDLELKSEGSTGAVHVLRFLAQNTTSQTTTTIEAQLLLRSRDGRVLSARLFPVEATLAPGESRFFEKEIHGLSSRPGDVLTLGTSLVPKAPVVLDRSDRIDAELEYLERLVEAPTGEMSDVLEGLRALEARSRRSLNVASSAPGEEEELVVDNCLNFCLRCAQVAAILCTKGVDTFKCDCSKGICEIHCK
jgi:hypothetical protein